MTTMTEKPQASNLANNPPYFHMDTGHTLHARIAELEKQLATMTAAKQHESARADRLLAQLTAAQANVETWKAKAFRYIFLDTDARNELASARMELEELQMTFCPNL